MKKILFLLLLLMAVNAKAQHSLEKIWETDTVMNVPESILPDFDRKLMYVSFVGTKENVGGVGIMDLNGKIINKDFSTGLADAKGLGRFGNRLYVALPKGVAVVDLQTGKRIKIIMVDNAVFLNDITIDKKGIVYVSDTRRSTVHKIENDIASTYLYDIKNANGLKHIGDDLFILSGEKLLKVSPDKKITNIATISCNGDGLEPVGNGDFIASCWTGYIFYIYADGRVETLLDSHEQKMNTADIAYDMKNRILYVPTFSAKKIIAYKLK